MAACKLCNAMHTHSLPYLTHICECMCTYGLNDKDKDHVFNVSIYFASNCERNGKGSPPKESNRAEGDLSQSHCLN